MKLKILFITTELIPFIKIGELAEVVTGLAKAIANLGHDVRIFIPRYCNIDKNKYRLQQIGPLSVPLGNCEKWCSVLLGNIPDTDIPVYFLENDEYYGRQGIYGFSHKYPFDDNLSRFTLFSRGVFKLCRMIGWVPDILHAQDWQTSLVPVYLNTLEQGDIFSKTASILTIYNIGYQGIFPREDIYLTQINSEKNNLDFEFYNQINLLKAGIINSDIITTVSPTYAKEILTPQYGFNLEGVLKQRSDDLYGILNGIDYLYWNPEFNRRIPAPYSVDNLSGKDICKKELQEIAGFKKGKHIPLICMVNRLIEQNGIEELCGPSYGCLYSICRDMNIQFVIMGTGDDWCERELSLLASRLSNLKVFLKHDERLAHRIEAGSDFFLIPSKYEPCGLNQMYAQRFGNLPIVRDTGGLSDTVEDYNEESGGGTGFIFQKMQPEDIYIAVERAVRVFQHRKDHFDKMRKRAMKKRFSWANSVKKYIDLYNAAVAKKNIKRKKE